MGEALGLDIHFGAMGWSLGSRLSIGRLVQMIGRFAISNGSLRAFAVWAGVSDWVLGLDLNLEGRF